jgi:DNA-binding MarR family transcriptional regulator
MVNLTAEGRQTIERLIPLARKATEETLSLLNAREATTLTKLLAKIA